MTKARLPFSIVRLAFLMSIGCTLFAQQRGPTPAAPAPAAPAQAGGRGAGGRGGAPAARVPLFFREEWKNEANTYEPKIEQIHVANPNLELKLLGPTGKEILIAGTLNSETNPIHPWTGMCTTPCGLTLRDKTRSVDLTGLARIKWNTKMSGLHQIHPVIRLASGALLVGDFADGSNLDWQEREFNLAGIKWYTLDPERGVTTGSVVANPDLSKVDEVGFIDLMPGSGHGQGGWADVAKFEVYGRPVPRQ
jgi:hypothetical protein